MANIVEVGLKICLSPLVIWTSPLKTLFMLYDASVNPVTYDFVWLLTGAEIARRRRGLNGIHIVLIAPAEWRAWGESAEYNALFDPEAIRWRFQNIVVPMCQLGPRVSAVTVCTNGTAARWIGAMFSWHRFPAGQTLLLPRRYDGRDYVFAAARDGRNSHVLAAPVQARRLVRKWLRDRAPERRVVTVTLRQSAYMRARNSDPESWAAFMDWLDSLNYAVVVIPDSDRAASLDVPKGRHALVFPEAALDVRVRLALYEQAFLNMGVNNGPLALAMFGDAALAVVKEVVSGAPQATVEFLRSHGFEPGEQPPFFDHRQRIFWDSQDSFDELCQVFRELEAALDGSADGATS
jgi:hypothetical protein